MPPIDSSSTRRAAVAAGAALACLATAGSPALAAPIGDGTSNTIQVAVTAATIDQLHRRVVVTTAQPGSLRPGVAGTTELVTPTSAFVFENVMVESLAGTPRAASLSYSRLKSLHGTGSRRCLAGVDTCLIEDDGTYPPF
jgi:hypothetical protein